MENSKLVKKMFEGKTVLVTGATGLIGSNLCKYLIDSGAHVIAVARNEKRLKLCFQKYMGHGFLNYIATDISKKIIVKESIDYVFHAAGSIAMKDIVNNPVEIINPNVIGTINLLELLKRQRDEKGREGRLVFFSSEAVYGRWIIDRSVKEADTSITDPLSSPRAPYSESKRMGEIIVSSYAKQYGMDAISVRLGWIYGNAEFKAKQALFDFIDTAFVGNDIVIRNANTHRRDNLSMADAMLALFLIAKKGERGQVYNISSGGDLGNYAAADEIAEYIADIVNERMPPEKQVRVVYETERSRRTGGVVMDNAKLKKLGWSVSTSLRDGLEKLVNEVYKNAN